MKITMSQLHRIIKEEVYRAINRGNINEGFLDIFKGKGKKSLSDIPLDDLIPLLKETGLDYAGNERLIDIAMDNCKNLDEFKSKLVPLFIELSERADEVHSKYGGSDFADKNKNKRKLQLVVYALKKKGFKWEFQNNLGFSLDKIYEKNAEKVKQEMEQ